MKKNEQIAARDLNEEDFAVLHEHALGKGDDLPTPATVELPPPSSWEELENIVADVVALQWRTPHVYRYGRQGQEQQGVDIVCRPPHLNQGYAGIQCKETSALRLAVVREAVEEAKEFKPALKELTVATTALRDARLQEQVRLADWPFCVELMFWEDISLALAGNEALLEKHYPSLARRRTSFNDVERLILRLGPTDFESDPQRGIYICKQDVLLQIVQLEEEERVEFNEKWVRCFFANKYSPASRQLFEVRYGPSVVRTEYFVAVDGYRHLIPFPRSESDLTISRFEYRLAKILDVNRVYDLDRALERCGIVVRDDA